MIYFAEDLNEMMLFPSDRVIIFDKDFLPKFINVIERGINTLSPPDPELIKLLDDMKGAK